VGRLHQAFEFVSGNHGDIATCAAFDHDDFTVINGSIHQAFELLTCLAVSGFDGHGVGPLLYNNIVQNMTLNGLINNIRLSPSGGVAGGIAGGCGGELDLDRVA
jgi:hypothetical protein